MRPIILLFKAYVKPHIRRLSSGKVVRVGGYHNKVIPKPKDDGGSRELFENLGGKNRPIDLSRHIKKESVKHPVREAAEEAKQMMLFFSGSDKEKKMDENIGKEIKLGKYGDVEVKRGKLSDGTGGYVLSFGYNQKMVDEIRAITGRKWIARDKKWFIPDGQEGTLMSFLRWAESFDQGQKRERDEAVKNAPNIELGSYGGIDISKTDKGYKVQFPYDKRTVTEVKKITGARYNPDDKSWSVPVESAQELRKWLPNKTEEDRTRDEVVAARAENMEKKKLVTPEPASKVGESTLIKVADLRSGKMAKDRQLGPPVKKWLDEFQSALYLGVSPKANEPTETLGAGNNKYALAKMPFTQDVVNVQIADPVSSWIKKAKDIKAPGPMEGMIAWQEYPNEMQSIIDLVKETGIVLWHGKDYRFEAPGDLRPLIDQKKAERENRREETKRTTNNMDLLKDIKIRELEKQVNALKTIPEGSPIGGSAGRVMKESRRDRYIKEGEKSLEEAKKLPPERFGSYRTTNLLFHDDLIL